MNSWGKHSGQAAHAQNMYPLHAQGKEERERERGWILQLKGYSNVEGHARKNEISALIRVISSAHFLPLGQESARMPYCTQGCIAQNLASANCKVILSHVCKHAHSWTVFVAPTRSLLCLQSLGNPSNVYNCIEDE